ncbi:MAG: TA system VapC family ribonuclease toxin [Gemmatimonadota bacterium]|nr:TA system VapC family ribonuclease toxin [Gemmatimonadota bacterium]
MGYVTMVSLLDVNVLVALFDPAHIHHEAAHEWFGASGASGWATCPLTENGLVRVISNPAYPGRRTTVADAVDRLRRFTESDGHVFWTDDVSLLDTRSIDASHVSGHREITDVYLLALAAHRGEALATFDMNIRSGAVPGAGKEHLTVISAKR